MASSFLTAFDIESLLEANVVMDITGDLRIRSDDTLTTITIADVESGIDVVGKNVRFVTQKKSLLNRTVVTGVVKVQDVPHVPLDRNLVHNVPLDNLLCRIMSPKCSVKSPLAYGKKKLFPGHSRYYHIVPAYFLKLSQLE